MLIRILKFIYINFKFKLLRHFYGLLSFHNITAYVSKHILNYLHLRNAQKCDRNNEVASKYCVNYVWKVYFDTINIAQLYQNEHFEEGNMDRRIF